MSAATSVRNRLSSPVLEQRLPEVRQRVVALVFWLGVPLFCLFVLVLGTDRLLRNVDNAPAGIPGSFVVTQHGCPNAICISGGTFHSADGNLTVYNLPASFTWATGDRHTVFYDASTGEVIPLPATWDATATVIGMGGAVLFLVLWGVLLYSSVRRRVGPDPSG
jgi:hypothetical protein